MCIDVPNIYRTYDIPTKGVPIETKSPAPNHPPFRSHLSTRVPPPIETLPEGSSPHASVLARDVLSLFPPSKMTVLAGDPISLNSYLHRQKQSGPMS